MRNLLHANFHRVWKSRIFWGCMALMLLYGLRLVYSLQEALQEGWTQDHPAFLFFTQVWFLLAAWYSSFLSGEYSDGAVRNKLVVGAVRPAIYFADLVTCIAVGLMLCAAFILPNWTLTSFFFGHSDAVNYIHSPGQTAVDLLAGALVIVSYSAIFSAVGMNIQHRAAGPVVVILTACVLYLNGLVCDMELALYCQAPEPLKYSRLRLAYDRFFAEWLPGGQGRYYVMHAGSSGKAPVLAAYSLIVIAASTAAGLLLFRRKDLK